MVQGRLEPPAWLTDIPGHLDDLDPEDARVDADGLAAARDGEFDVDRTPEVLTYEGLAQRHDSPVHPSTRLRLPGRARNSNGPRGICSTTRYDSVEDALADVDKTAGWDRMREIRESHNDVTFLDAFLSEEFVRANHYFAYEYSHVPAVPRLVVSTAT